MAMCGCTPISRSTYPPHKALLISSPTAHSHKQGLLNILQCEPTKEAVANALAQWPVEEFEAAAFERHLCAAALRSFETMDKTPHGIYQTNIHPVSITKIGEAPKRVLGGDPAGGPQYALEGLRVLDLTRVLAGPVCGRTLAGKSRFTYNPFTTVLHYRVCDSARRGRPPRDVAAPAVAPVSRRGHLAR